MKRTTAISLLGVFCFLPGIGRTREEDKLSVDCRDVPVRWALALLTKVTGKSMLLGPGVSGNLTFTVADSSFQKVMEKLTESSTTPWNWRMEERFRGVVETAFGIRPLAPVPYRAAPTARTLAVASRGEVRMALVEFGGESKGIGLVSVGMKLVDPGTKVEWTVSAIDALGTEFRSGEAHRMFPLMRLSLK